VDNRQIVYSQGKYISSFKSSVFKTCYKFPNEEIALNEYWVKEVPLKPSDMMRNWWVPGKNFKIGSSDDYSKLFLRTPYQCVVAMLYRLYGEVDAQKFRVSWVPLIHSITTTKSIFNWEVILSSTLEEVISSMKHMNKNKQKIINLKCQMMKYIFKIRREVS
jgi:hypothetical protein